MYPVPASIRNPSRNLYCGMLWMVSTIQYVVAARSANGSARKDCHSSSSTSLEPLAKLMSRGLLHTESGHASVSSKAELTTVWWL